MEKETNMPYKAMARISNMPHENIACDTITL